MYRPPLRSACLWRRRDPERRYRADLYNRRIVDCQEAIQNAVASRQGEIEQLRKTIVAMREELEASRARGQEAVQNAVANSADEIRQLRETVVALRNELEGHRTRHSEEMQAARAAARDEMRHLEQMIVALREELEKIHAR